MKDVENKEETKKSRKKQDTIENENNAKENDKEKANGILKTAVSNLDKCTSKGLIKKNTCARQKARLNKKVKEMN